MELQCDSNPKELTNEALDFHMRATKTELDKLTNRLKILREEWERRNPKGERDWWKPKRNKVWDVAAVRRLIGEDCIEEVVNAKKVEALLTLGDVEEADVLACYSISVSYDLNIPRLTS